uniref:Probable protein-export membrane protein SecG n=1 Tax=Scinaia undulata TaxID=1884664 RepID=A0A1G4NXJ0_9FLOR|nr:hypothetical protein P8465_pgp090 [Scinaia undulata]SCW23413.1 secG [Scinaia undulata]
MKFLWYACSLLLIVLILINSPKSNDLGLLSGTNKLFASTNQAVNTLEILTWCLIFLFICLAVVLRLQA